MLKSKEIFKFMSELAPQELAKDWDNPGLQVGDVEQTVNKVLLTLDVTQKVIDEAVENNCDLIISHHPLIFNSLDKIDFNDEKGKIISKAIKNKTGIFSAHTNLDIASGGLNDYLAQKLNILHTKPLVSNLKKNYKKLVVFVPEENLTQLRQVMLELGAGKMGNYSHCSFAVKGQGSFKPLAGSRPYQGEKNKLNKTAEYRLEAIVAADKIDEIVDKMLEKHPYEQPAYDIFELENLVETKGIGRIGFLKEKLKLEDFLAFVQDKLNLSHLKYVGAENESIKKVALCSGSGGDFIETAAHSGADLYLSGDIKFHQAQQAEVNHLCLIDAGHYGTEKIVKEMLKKKLNKEFDDISFIISRVNTNPFKIINN